MPNQHKIVTSYSSEGGTSIIKTEEIEGTVSINVEEVIPGGAVNHEIDVAIPLTGLKGFAFACSKVSGQLSSLTFTGLTLKTNSTGSPADTFTITPANGIAWSVGDASITNPIGTAITTIYITNAGTADANFVARALRDATS